MTIKAILEADLIGSFHRTRSHGIRWKGFSQGALDGVDLSTPERTHQVLRQEINFMVAHSLHRHSESLVNTLERGLLEQQEEPGTDLEKQTWLAKYATPTNLQSSAPAVGSELEKQAWLAKYATPANLEFDSCSQHRGSDHSIEHVRIFGTWHDLGIDELRVRFFAQSLTDRLRVVHIAATGLNPDLEAVGRAVPHAISLEASRLALRN
ncbi:hypothetical protein QYE76_024360 [Lolium multiflorum]|uniref:Uncharacterized protein n=1 Tax=Lolium multiflorum TaxID=4521 RepID=A0AAD8VVZ9_LOLMU|nr:hypothetical protein QYE76_024360 [Lolium multiflorum]